MRLMLAILSMAATLAPPAWATPAPAGMTRAMVVHVDDGDTIAVRFRGRQERVRYIGIDAPEIAHNGEGGERDGEVATTVNRGLVGGRRVGLEFDAETRDHYGRLLAYVWRDDTMINLEMVRRGYARAITIPPNLRYARWFRAAEAEARAGRRGQWGPDGPAASAALEHRPRPRGAVPHVSARSHPRVRR